MKSNYSQSAGTSVPEDRYDTPERWTGMLENNESYYSFVTASAPDTAFEECRAVWIGGAGNLAITGSDGSEATFESVAAGTLVKVRFIKLGADTTATKITLLY